MSEETRNRLRNRVDSSRAAMTRIPAEDREPPESYADLARDYPFGLLAGGMALGLIAGALLPRGTGRKAVRLAITAATLASELGTAYGRQALEKSEELGREGRARLGEAGTKAATAAAETAQKGRRKGGEIAREAIRIASKLRH